jgi:hypothetical protein
LSQPLLLTLTHNKQLRKQRASLQTSCQLTGSTSSSQEQQQQQQQQQQLGQQQLCCAACSVCSGEGSAQACSRAVNQFAEVAVAAAAQPAAVMPTAAAVVVMLSMQHMQFRITVQVRCQGITLQQQQQQQQRYQQRQQLR